MYLLYPVALINFVLMLEQENDPQELSDIIWYIEVTRKRESG